VIRGSDVLYGLLAACMLVGPAWIGGDLAGGAEVHGHAWVQWEAAARWPAWPAHIPLAGGTWSVIDPLPTWLAAGLSRAIGPVHAWNALMAAFVTLAAVGGGALVRAAGGVGAIGAVGLAFAPPLLGSLGSGLTEDGAIGLVALGLAALLERRHVLAGVLLGGATLCGLVVGWLGAGAALAVTLTRVIQARAVAEPGRTSLRATLAGPALAGPALAGAVALPLALGALLPHSVQLANDGFRTVPAPPPYEAAWRLNPTRGADLASFVAPRTEPGRPVTSPTAPPGTAWVQQTGREHPVYLGWVLLALAAFAGRHPAWLGLAAALVVAPGQALTWMGTPLGAGNPLYALARAVPGVSGVHHAARFMLAGQLALLVLAGRGAARLVVRFPELPHRAHLAVLLEALLVAPARVPMARTPAGSPAIYAALADLPAGPVSVAGAAGPGRSPQQVYYDRRAHGRPLLHDPNTPRDGRPTPGSVFVVLGGPGSPRRTQTEATLGPPRAATNDGAAWWIPPVAAPASRP
jgi:hypothetical protein